MIAIIADIHGNLPALEAVLAGIEKQGCEKIISLGDVAGYYPFLNDCINILRERNVINLIGNHDYYLLSGLGCPRSKSANFLSKIQIKDLAPANLSWLAQSKLCFKADKTFMVHGGIDNPIDEYIYTITDKYFSRIPFQTIFTGHTHIQGKFELKNGQVYCNPGSVGQPRDGNCDAAFAILKNNGEINLHRVEYDIDRVVFSLRKEGVDQALFNNLYQGTRIGGKVDNVEYSNDI